MSPPLLERLSKIITRLPNWTLKTVDPTPFLASSDSILLQLAEASLYTLCDEAKHSGIPLLLDAEQSHRQPAIDWIALRLMSKYNRGPKPVIYNTYQVLFILFSSF